MEQNDLNVEYSMTGIKREGEREREGATQKQPPSDVLFQILGGVPFSAGLELEGGLVLMGGWELPSSGLNQAEQGLFSFFWSDIKLRMGVLRRKKSWFCTLPAAQ